VITHPLLVGTDGREKMSKSLGNTIGITDPPEQIYGRTMSVSDELMLAYIDVLGFGRWDDLAEACEAVRGGGGDPLALKQTLASRVVERFHGTSAARDAAVHFRKVVQDREVPDEVPEFLIPLGPRGDAGLLDVLRKAFDIKSNGEARRLVTQGAVRMDGEPVTDPTCRLRAGTFLLRAGKRRYARVELQ
jgi:tyrosyl-tRNA synthetase